MTTNDHPMLFCFGYGFSAAALGERLATRGFRIVGTRRDSASVESLRLKKIVAYLFDGTTPMAAEARADLARACHVLISAPPAIGIGDPVLRHHADDIVNARGIRWLGYLSTTGVYGDKGGAWVDESTPPLPSGERGQARLVAENAWLDLWRKHGVPVHIFRLAGIYGPGRSALDSVRDGTAKRIDKPGQVFSRIHVDDIAAVLEASIARPRPGAIYNVCDDKPAPPPDVITFACELLKVAPPPVVAYEAVAPTLSPMARSFYAENKRVSNARIKNELGVRLRYPDYRVGLRALLEANTKR